MSDKRVPAHVGIIMDGNGRWATSRMLPRNAGHKKGVEVLTKITQHALSLGIKHLTVFAFSTENFNRTQEEIDGIFDLMRSYLKDQNKNKNPNIRLRFLGDTVRLPRDIVEGIGELALSTAENIGMDFNIAFNYGGRHDILQAAKKLAEDYKSGKTPSLDSVDEQSFQQYLYTQEQPSMDLLIRTSGEMRISNFLIWQSAYAEFVFTEQLWPDYTPKNFDEAIEVYASRSRRLGGV